MKRKQIGKAIASGGVAALLAASMFATAAFADDPNPEVVTPEGDTGSSELWIKIHDLTEREVPDDNVNFTTPTRINYVAEADGDVFGPSNAHIGYIKNKSGYRAYVSAYQATGEAGWNIVEDAPNVGTATRNAVDIVIGPSGDQRNIAEGGTTITGGTQKAIQGAATGSKVALTNAAWDMKAKDTTSNEDRVDLATSGHIANIDLNINDYVKFATINWYVTPGTRS